MSTTFYNEFAAYQANRRAFWDGVAQAQAKPLGACYRRRLAEVYGLVIPVGARVLEVGCATGDLLAALEPSYGLGIDLSPAMIERARNRHPHLDFRTADVHELELKGEWFEFIVLSDVVNDLWDVQAALQRLRPLCSPRTRLVFNFFSHLWQVPLTLARRMGLATPNPPQNWLTCHDMRNLLELSGFEPLRDWQEVLLPLPGPLARWVNRYFPKLPVFRAFALTNFLVARPVMPPLIEQPSVSVVIPTRNEKGHIDELMARVPDMGSRTELVFVEGNSSDDTWSAIERAIAVHPDRQCRLLKQLGNGKGDAVRAGFAVASGDILMILDADITVPPEDLPRFYDVLVSGRAEFVNGVRLVYPMQEEAMRFANLLGNKFFSWAFSWLLGQPVRDTLCGTKVLWTADYRRIEANRAYFGDFDPFGDFDLLFGAAKLNLKIMEVPIRYRARRYGDTNIQRWRHGWLLLRMVVFAARRIKFV